MWRRCALAPLLSLIRAAKNWIETSYMHSLIDQSCPLCTSSSSKELERISFAQIWQSLEKNHGARFSDDVVRRHTPATHATLIECQECGLHYFVPSIPGDESFYGELTVSSDAYYNDDKWDFEEAMGFISVGDRVLDIACGSGQFLKISQRSGCVSVGIDTNNSAVREAFSNGLMAYCVDLDTHARGHLAEYDVVTAFQVIEHVANVASFVQKALACLKPGGKLILTVPNRQRRFSSEFEPLDCPPHHLSRWDHSQLTKLAALYHCQVVDLRFEPMGMHDCRSFLRRRIFRELAAESILARAFARLIFSPTLYAIYRRCGWLDTWRLWRMSVMCILAKPKR